MALLLAWLLASSVVLNVWLLVALAAHMPEEGVVDADASH